MRVYLPPDANCLLSVWDHCLRSRHDVNVVIAGKYQAPQWLTYRRTNHGQLHVRGYKEEGTITTYFDMTVLNDLDRFHLVQDAIQWVGSLGSRGEKQKEMMTNTLSEHKRYTDQHGVDLPEIRDWRWSATNAGRSL